jgi:hypothetical protein
VSDLPVIDGLSLGIGRKMAMGVAADIAKVLVPVVAGLTPEPDGLPNTLILTNGRFGSTLQLNDGRLSTTILVRRDGPRRVRVEDANQGGWMPPFSLPCREDMSDDGETMAVHAMRGLAAVTRALTLSPSDGGWQTGAPCTTWALALAAAAQDMAGVPPECATLPGPWSDTGLMGSGSLILADPVRLAFDAHAPRFVRLTVENSNSRPVLRLSEVTINGGAIDPDRDPMATLRALAMAAEAGALPG